MKHNLPRAVREAATKADQMLEEMQRMNEQLVTPDTVQETPPVVEEAPVVVSPVNVEPDRDAKYWEHRAKTIKGMHDADLARMKGEIENLKRDKQEALDKANAAIKAIPREYDLRKYFSEVELETYGEDMIKTVLRASAKMLDERTESVDKIGTELADVKSRLEYTEQMSAEQKKSTFWAVFQAQVPDWQKVNDDPEFHTWLGEVDPVAGEERQSILTSAESRLDGARVAQIFNTFKQVKLNKATPPVRNKERMVVPESAQSVTNLNPEADWITSAEINKFSNDVIRGFYKNRPKEQEATEKKINAAIANRRIK